MKKSNSHVTKNTGINQLNVQRCVACIPNVGDKMFRLTSESAGSIR